MKKAALFCQHSVTAPRGDIEAFGITIIEAMACGVPVVVTRHNGFPETVVDGITGFMVPEHDVHAMAAAMKRLLADSELRRKMGKAARDRVIKKFTSSQNIENLKKILLG